MPRIRIGDLPLRTSYIGVDPGASGGISLIAPSGITTWGMPATEADLLEVVKSCYGIDWKDRGITPYCYAVVEKVTGFVGGPGNTGSSMFKFGASYGSVRMALIASGIPFEEVMASVWQKGLKIPSRGKSESKTAWKNRLKARAQQLFPGVEVTLKTADALLIAEFCRRKREGTL